MIPQMGIRHLLRVSGVSSFVYWLHFFIGDALVFLMPALLMLILIPAFQLPSLSSPAAMGCLVLVVLLYLPSTLVFVYVVSFLFSKWDTCQQVMPQLFLYVSVFVCLFVCLFVLTFWILITRVKGSHDCV